MSAEHTPGPWLLETAPTSCGICHKIGPFPWRGGKQNHACIYVDHPGTGAETQELEANARLIAAAPDLLAAIKIQHECGPPEKVSLYDEECVDGWRWTHPDGREWTETGDWNEPPPMHPDARRAIAKALGGAA